MPRSRNTRIRPKNTSRVEARRRYRDEQREAEADTEELGDDTTTEAVAEEPKRSMFGFQMPNILEDLKSLPGVFRKPLVWLPFGLLLLTLVSSILLINGTLDDLPDPVREGLTLYISLTLHPTSLFIFFIGGFVAPRASYMVGGMLGILSAFVYLAVLSIANDAAQDANLDAVTTSTGGDVPAVTSEVIIQTLGLGLLIGVVAGGFAAWYRRFLRSSQERAKQNRMQKEQEQAKKAKEQARADKEAARKSRRES